MFPLQAVWLRVMVGTCFFFFSSSISSRCAKHMWSYPDKPGLPACGDDSPAPHMPPKPSHNTPTWVLRAFPPITVRLSCTFAHTHTHTRNEGQPCMWLLFNGTLWAEWALARNWPGGELLTQKSAIQTSNRLVHSQFCASADPPLYQHVRLYK